MKLIIDIPDNEYKYTCERTLHDRTMWDDAIRNGIPLPKGHGRLIDESKITSCEWNGYLNYMTTNAPTIIEADKAESEEA